MKLIAAVDKNWGLGRDGHLLLRIPEDMRNFRRHTMGGVVILGRKTLQTFPHAAPLPGRDNIILSGSADFSCPGAEVAHSLPELFGLLMGKSAGREAGVVGGAQIYDQLLPYCEEAVLTHIKADLQADCFLTPVLPPWWSLVEKSPLLIPK